MNEPKFKPGTLVKYSVCEQWHYNNVVDSYYNSEVNMHIYSLDEKTPLPLYREDQLVAVSVEEESWLRQLVREDKVLFGDMGYMYTQGGEVYVERSNSQKSKDDGC